MAVSVRLDPVVEAKLTQQANLLGITKSDFIKDAIERVLGTKRSCVRNLLIDAGPLIRTLLGVRLILNMLNIKNVRTALLLVIQLIVFLLLAISAPTAATAARASPA